MARWQPDAQGRLQRAAMTLFLERGYSEVTVSDIADRAGLTKRTFFNHFADKREVLFAGANAFEASVVEHLTAAEADLDPFDAALSALTYGGRQLAGYGQSARARRDLIASSTDLQERTLIKMTSLARAISQALIHRHVAPRAATFTAQAAVAVFTAAYDDWVDNEGADFGALMQQSLHDLKAAIGSPPPHPS